MFWVVLLICLSFTSFVFSSISTLAARSSAKKSAVPWPVAVAGISTLVLGGGGPTKVRAGVGKGAFESPVSNFLAGAGAGTAFFAISAATALAGGGISGSGILAGGGTAAFAISSAIALAGGGAWGSAILAGGGAAAFAFSVATGGATGATGSATLAGSALGSTDPGLVWPCRVWRLDLFGWYAGNQNVNLNYSMSAISVGTGSIPKNTEKIPSIQVNESKFNMYRDCIHSTHCFCLQILRFDTQPGIHHVSMLTKIMTSHSRFRVLGSKRL